MEAGEAHSCGRLIERQLVLLVQCMGGVRHPPESLCVCVCMRGCGCWLWCGFPVKVLGVHCLPLIIFYFSLSPSLSLLFVIACYLSLFLSTNVFAYWHDKQFSMATKAYKNKLSSMLNMQIRERVRVISVAATVSFSLFPLTPLLPVCPFLSVCLSFCLSVPVCPAVVCTQWSMRGTASL